MSEPQVILRHLFNPKVVQLGHALRFRALKCKARKNDTLFLLDRCLFIVEYVYTAFQVKVYLTREIFLRFCWIVKGVLQTSSTHLTPFFFFLAFITTQTPSLHYLSQTILHISTEITKIKHQMSRTTHAHCSTTVFRTGRKGLLHICCSIYLHLPLLKKKVIILLFFLHFKNSSSELTTCFYSYLVLFRNSWH